MKEGEKMSSLVSVVIPAYNVEKYIERGINSVLEQTYSNIELVIVDDGSTDKTWEIITGYKKLENNLIAVHQNNAGVSSARNMALDLCNGRYVIFLDSDDWLERDAVEYLVDLAIKNPGFFINVDRYFAIINEQGKIEKERQRKDELIEKVDLEDALMNTGTGKYNLQSSCYKLFDMEIINKNRLRFDSHIYHGEDGLFVFQYLNNCNGIVFSTKPLWNILERTGSATTSPYNSKWLSMVDAVDIMIKHCQHSDKIKKALRVYRAERAVLLANAYFKNGALPKGDKKIIKKRLKESGFDFFQSSKSCWNKLKYLCFLIFPTPILKLIRIKNKH